MDITIELRTNELEVLGYSAEIDVLDDATDDAIYLDPHVQATSIELESVLTEMTALIKTQAAVRTALEAEMNAMFSRVDEARMRFSAACDEFNSAYPLPDDEIELLQ